MTDANPQPLVLRQDQGHIARLTLNSPSNYNALSLAMIAALEAELDRIAADNGIRVVVLAAVGKAFSAGHDLREMQAARGDSDAGRAAYEQLFQRCAAMMQKLPALPQPVIAEVQGIATAAGCQLVASCDMAVAAEGVRFGVNGVNIGLFCSTPMVALARAIPPRAAFELLVTGEFIDAARARTGSCEPRRPCRRADCASHGAGCDRRGEAAGGGAAGQARLSPAGAIGAGRCLCRDRHRHVREHDARRHRRRNPGIP